MTLSNWGGGREGEERGEGGGRKSGRKEWVVEGGGRVRGRERIGV